MAAGGLFRCELKSGISNEAITQLCSGFLEKAIAPILVFPTSEFFTSLPLSSCLAQAYKTSKQRQISHPENAKWPRRHRPRGSERRRPIYRRADGCGTQWELPLAVQDAKTLDPQSDSPGVERFPETWDCPPSRLRHRGASAPRATSERQESILRHGSCQCRLSRSS